ncbi:C40 family peptidase [Clostridium sp. C105KSO13]|uniref:C40 family peptidase n=1 Tax=Clostridium sp. C105KSO13 TaxID=1776045 RepID=UPI0007406D07|nr:Gamma-D-glutamyl-L-lysine endopeptidase [Clostridium sp. C105KSO13]
MKKHNKKKIGSLLSLMLVLLVIRNLLVVDMAKMETNDNKADRSSLLKFASQFIGNPYVWGGTSLTKGADCSGFVQSVYRQYGYDLPRLAEDQAKCGVQVPVEDAQPGDLIFYAKEGYVYHVVIYAGEGKTIEAMNPDMGIVQGNVDTVNAVWASRILNERFHLQIDN